MEGGGGGYEGAPVFDPSAGAGQIDPELALKNQSVPPGQPQQSGYNGIGPGADGKPLGPGTKIGDGSGNLPTGGADRRPKFPKASAGSVSGKGGSIGYTPVKGK